MLKVVGIDRVTGGKVVIVGISAKEIADLQANPRISCVYVQGNKIELPVDMIIFYGKTETEMAERLKEVVGDNTVVQTRSMK